MKVRVQVVDQDRSDIRNFAAAESSALTSERAAHTESDVQDDHRDAPKCLATPSFGPNTPRP